MELSLDKSQKTKLIEVMLLVGTLFAMFNLPKNLMWAFGLFALLSFVYMITLNARKDEKEQGFEGAVSGLMGMIIFQLVPLFMSVLFTLVLVSYMGTSLLESFPGYSIEMWLVSILLYHVVFVVVVYKALTAPEPKKKQ